MEEELKTHGERIIDSFRTESAHSHRSNKVVPVVSSDQLLKDMMPQVSGSFEPMDLPDKAHVKNFSTGHIFQEDLNRKLPDIKAQQIPFVPLSLALKHVRRMEEDMKKMHEQHKSLLIEIDNCYAGIEQETHNKYREFIEKWKEQMKNKVEKYKTASKQLKNQNETYRSQASGNIDTLREKVNSLTAEKNELLMKYNNDVLGKDSEHSSLMRTVEEDYSKRISTLQTERNALKAYEVGHVKDISSLMVELILSKVDRAIAEGEAADPLYRLGVVSSEEIPGGLLREEYFKKKRELKNVKAAKLRAEREIDEWNEEFERENNREPNNFDKAKVKHLYVNYLELKNDEEAIRKRIRQIREQALLEGIELDAQESDQVSSINQDILNDNKLLRVEVEKLKKRLAQASEEKSPKIPEATVGVDIAKHNADIEKYRDEIDRHNLEIAELKRELEEADKRYVSILEGEKAEKESLNRELQTLKASLLVSKDSDDPITAQLKAQLAGYSQEIENLRKETSRIAGEKAGLEQQNYTNTEKIAELQRDLAKIPVLEAQIESLKAIEKQFSKYPKLQAQCKKQQETIQDLESQIISLKAALTAPAPVLLSASSSDSEQVTALRKELERLTQEAQEAYKELSLKDRELKSASRSDNTQLAEELERANLKIAELKAASKSSVLAPAPDISQYTFRIKQLEAELQALRSSSVPVPLVSPVPVSSQASNPQDAAEIDNLRKEIKVIKEKYDSEITTLKQFEERAKAAEERVKAAEEQTKAVKDQAKSAEQYAKASEAKLQEAIAQFKKLEKSKADIEKELKLGSEKEAALQSQIETLKVAAGEAAELNTKVKELTLSIAELKEKNQQKEQELKDSLRQRKLLHNQLEDLKGKIRVYCRIRPMNRSEVSKKCNNILTISDEFTVNSETKQGQIKPFVYDSVFGPNSSQDEIFEDTKRLIQSAVDGYNVCIFAYGQTGSGKTFTIQGDQAHPGVTPRAIEELFSILGKMPSHYTWSVSCYMLEIYLDNLVDLLIPNEMRGNPPQLNIKKDIKGMVVVPEAYVVVVNSPGELYNLFLQGNTHRHTSSTKMNDTSSRSHLIFSVLIDVTNNETNQRTVGKLSLVDLAGSERVKKTDATADRLKEGRAINKSLTALGDVISALSSGESHIPYRNNKLTMLMSDSLGGTAKTLMFVNVSPADYNREETLMSLYYASRVKLITNEPIKNVESKEMSKLKHELIMIQVERDNYRKALEKSGIRPDAIAEMVGQEAEDFDNEKYDEL